MKTKIFLILLNLGLAVGFAYAADTNDTTLPLSNDIPLTAPTQQQGSWSFGVMGGLMQSTNNTNVGHNAANNNTLAGGDVRYDLSNSSNDVSLSYERGF